MGIRTRDLLACSIVPQPTTLPRAPVLEYSLPFNILFGIALSSILSTCPKHLILCDLIHLTISSSINVITTVKL
jgi:hypothetical protein